MHCRQYKTELLKSLAQVLSNTDMFERITGKIEEVFMTSTRYHSDTDQMLQEIIYAIKPNLSSNLDVERSAYQQNMAKVRQRPPWCQRNHLTESVTANPLPPQHKSSMTP